jgi:hypothetical protein
LQFESAESGEKAAILGLNRLFLGLKRGKIGGLQLLIRQQGKNASYLFSASYEHSAGRKNDFHREGGGVSGILGEK